MTSFEGTGIVTRLGDPRYLSLKVRSGTITGEFGTKHDATGEVIILDMQLLGPFYRYLDKCVVDVEGNYHGTRHLVVSYISYSYNNPTVPLKGIQMSDRVPYEKSDAPVITPDQLHAEFKAGIQYGLDLAIKFLDRAAVLKFQAKLDRESVVLRDAVECLKEEKATQDKTGHRTRPYIK